MSGGSSRLWLSLCVAAAILPPSGMMRQAAAQGEAVAVEPADLVRRDDLVGKLVSIDDRVRFFQNHPRTGYDELYLRRTPIAFHLPPELRPKSAPRAPGVIVQGRLTKDNDRLAFDVTSLTLQPSDQERFDKAVGTLSAKDFENRKAWAKWAEKRATDFKDDALKKRAQTVEAEALRIEAETKRVTIDAPDEWLKLAEEARRRKVPEPDPSALAHRAYRAKLANATSVDDLKAVQAGVERFFPDAAKDQASGAVPLGRWAEDYNNDPAAYRSAPVAMRKPLDRRLWADVVGRLLETQAAHDVQATLEIIGRAEALIPERPELIAKLVDHAQTQARQNLPSLRYAEVKSIGALLRDRANKPDAALEFYRAWLKSQRDRLSATDAEGRVALASRFEELLQDADSARELLEKAWKIAPGSDEVAEAFKLRNYRRVGDDWVRDAPLSPAPGAEAASAPAASPNQGLRGKTPEEVRNSLATEPTSRSFVGTKGRLIEQWIFVDTRQKRYVNFLLSPGDLKPRVISDYFLPRQGL
ncbi:hypothetical protein [Paludisphaera borealis]|uniref:Uncharacterized protein n=1 Tax=Paludisphaera borealis TaxID=1387353 RepID=A0A1U7CP98_9BACT|nr:hypothetical protein [Paludisphaera borealis]APW60764.1 hypothetical protein BSF38_02253 [Paludisphaera borealis]